MRRLARTFAVWLCDKYNFLMVAHFIVWQQNGIFVSCIHLRFDFIPEHMYIITCKKSGLDGWMEFMTFFSIFTKILYHNSDSGIRGRVLRRKIDISLSGLIVFKLISCTCSAIIGTDRSGKQNRPRSGYSYSFRSSLIRACTVCHFQTHSNSVIPPMFKFGPRHEKTCLRGFRPVKTQTGLLSYRDELGSWNFGYSK